MTAIDPEPTWRFNDARYRSFADKGRQIAFVCECGADDCRRAVLLSPEEYEARRPGPVLHDSHAPKRDPAAG